MNRRDTSRPGVEGVDSAPPRDAPQRAEVRVVLLSGASAELASLQIEGVRCIRAPTPYDAVAEILSAPAAALVVELRLLRGRHLRVLEIARQMDVEVLAVGTVPRGLTGEDLSGVRLTARRDLPGVLARLTGTYEASAPPERDETPAPAVRRPLTGRTSEEPGTHPKEHAGEESVAKISGEPSEGQYKPEPAAAETDPPARTPPGKQPQQTASPSDLLTPEELTALLENEP